MTAPSSSGVVAATPSRPDRPEIPMGAHGEYVMLDSLIALADAALAWSQNVIAVLPDGSRRVYGEAKADALRGALWSAAEAYAADVAANLRDLADEDGDL